MTKSVNTRELILGILLEVTEKEAYSHLIIRDVLNKYGYLEKQERAFITRTTEGTIENLIRLDYIINRFSKVKTTKMKPVIRGILRMSVYQLLYMDSVPASAVCNEAVKLAQRKGFASLKGFVNGVLRTISREAGHMTFPDEQARPLYALSVQYSIPEWILEKWLSAYGYPDVKIMLEGFLHKEGTAIRCNTSKISPDKLMEALLSEGVKVSRAPYIDSAFMISSYNRIDAIKAFQNGLFQVQDISSMLCIQAAGIKEGDYVLDVCAAPGGKSLHAADILHGTGFVEARDLTAYKTGLLTESISRSGFSNIKAVMMDGRIPDQASEMKADVLIADLPCSGLGVIGRKTDIKYNMTADKQKELVKLQREILTAVWQYVKPGGILMYSTCTINREENEKTAAWLAESFPLEPEPLILPAGLAEENTCQLQLLPGHYETDGFFMAKFKRRL